MALLRKEERDRSARLVAAALAAGLPFATYLATASGYAYWLDGGEFVSQAAELGISHPPGHPLSGMLLHGLTLVPLGSLDFRVALASAIFAAIAAAFLFFAIDITVRSLGVKRDLVALPLAIFATWLVAGSPGFFFQAVRPEVYALEAMISCIALERIVTLESEWPTHDLRPLYVAMLAIGFGLANHHFLAFLLFPTIAPTLARAKRARGNRPVLLALGALVPGLSTYLYLPVRASAGAALSLGDPTTIERIFWVVSAQAFQKNQGDGVPQPLVERFMDVAVQLVESLHFVPFFLAIGGFYALLRTAGAHRIGYIWLSTFVVHVVARAWLGFVRSNPDALGYLMPAFAAAAAAGGAFVAAVLSALGGARQEQPRKTAIAIAFVSMGLGLTQIQRGAEASSLARFTATDAFDDGLRRNLPPRAVVIAHEPQTIFRYWGGESSEHLRPDVTLVPVPFLSYPNYVNALTAEHPELRGVLRSYLLEGELTLPELQSLAAERPVLVELDPHVPLEVYPTLAPYGLYHEALPDAAYEGDLRLGLERERTTLERLYAALGDERTEHETAARLLTRHFTEAVFYAAVRDRDAAREALARALVIAPDDAQLAALGAALSGEEDVDVRPFLAAPEL